MEAGAIADALTSNRGMNITTRSPASFRQIIYGTQRVGGIQVYRSTTGSHHDQFNYVIVLATHEIDAIENLYLDGRQVFWSVGSTGNTTRNGVNFGGSSDGNTHIGPDGQHYNFGGPLVYCEARYGDQVDGDVIGALTANDPTWTSNSLGSPWLGGCAYVYLKVEFDQNSFPGEPEVRFTIRGKNNIADPRTGTAGYTTNWALIVGDIITDNIWGLNDQTVNQAQLIVAANVCDEVVQLAAATDSEGGAALTEARYACNYHYDTSTSPGDAISTVMAAAQGRLSRIGGEWYIWPAYFQGASFATDDSIVIQDIQWDSEKSFDTRFNRVTGTYVAANFPYNIAGNLYDSNGWWNNTIQNNFPFAFQPTNYPQYAADTLHGFADDQFLLQDGGIPLPKEITQSACMSVAQAQRCAKIALLRNRQQGSGQMICSLAAYQLQPVDVMEFTTKAQPFGWTNKLLEITNTSFVYDKGDDKRGPTINVHLSVQETDPSVYDWNPATDELTVYSAPAALQTKPLQPAAPTVMTLDSGSSTAVVSVEGIKTPRVQVGWTAPLDAYVTQIQIQYAPTGTGAWIDVGTVDVGSQSAFVSGVVSNVAYDFRIRSLRASGATSDWLQESNYTVSTTITEFLTSEPFALLGGAVEAIIINFTTTNSGVSFSWTAQTALNADGTSQTVNAGTLSYSSLTASTTYYTYWYIDVATGNLLQTNANPPSTTPSSVLAAQTALDGRDAVGVISFTTLAASNPGTGSGTGGGGNTCPEAAELVTVLGKGNIRADAVKVGDMILGHSFKNKQDVYRRVYRVATRASSSWRMVDGHRVSPCEAVYHEGAWKPAFQCTGADVDAYNGTKVLLTVQSDEYAEQNYYLVGGTQLLIHNMPSLVNPC